MPYSSEQTEGAIQKIGHMRQKSPHEDYRNKDQQINSLLINARAGMGQKVSNAIGQLGPSVGTSTGMQGVGAISNRTDRLKETMKTTNGETKYMLELTPACVGNG